MNTKRTQCNIFSHFLIILLLICSSFNALGQGLSSLSPLPEWESEKDTLTLSDTEKLVQTLENPQERKKFIKNLKGLIAVQKKAEASKTILDQITHTITESAEYSAQTIFTITTTIAQLPEEATKIINNIFQEDYQKNLEMLAWVFFLAIVVGLCVELPAHWVLGFIFKKISLKRPLAIFSLRLMMRILPLFLFGLFSYLTILAASPTDKAIQTTTATIVTVLLIFRTILITAKILLAPKHPDVRMLPVKSDFARHVYRFAFALGQIIFMGSILAFLGLQLGISSQAYILWQKAVGLGVMALLIVCILESKEVVYRWLKPTEKSLRDIPQFFSILILLLTRYWHLFTILILTIIYVLWITGATNKAIYLAKSVLLSIVVFGALRFSRKFLSKFWIKTTNRLKSQDANLLTSSLLQSGPFFRQVILLSLYILGLIIFFDIWGISLIQLLSNKVVKPYFLSGLTILLIFLLTKLVWGSINFLVEAHVKPRNIDGVYTEPTLFAKTVAPIVRSVGHWILILLTSILILEELGVPIVPILYGISVIGIAISLGAQSLVKDIINGVLTLMEGNMAVGEVVSIGQFTGTVESLTLRGVSLRHSNGALQTIPFSEVNNIINKSRDYSVIPIEIAVSHATNINKVYEALHQTSEEMSVDPIFGPQIISPLQITGIEKFTDTSVHVTSLIRTTPDPKNLIAKEFNRRLKIRLDSLKILQHSIW